MTQWSQYSKDIFDKFTMTDDDIIVQAAPGSGKTTNIKHMWSLTTKACLYLVFAKHNQVEAEGKLPKRDNSDVLTLNALGHKIINRTYGKVKLDNRKVYRVIKENIKFEDKKQAFENSGMLADMVAMCKMVGDVNEISVETIDGLASVYDLDTYDDMYKDVVEVLGISDDTTDVIDFNDQIRFPAIKSMDMPAYDIVLGDEVQDFSPMQAKMMSRLDCGRYVLVGDKHQAIYGFRGAMNNSMEVLKETFGCVEMPLAISYRCGKSIVAEARRLYKDIEQWDAASDGIVRYGHALDEVYDDNTLVLCRYNIPLINLAFELLSRGVACHVRGRDIAKGMIKLIKQQQCSSVGALVKSLDIWLALETQKANAKQDKMKLHRVQDKYNSVMVFAKRYGEYDNVQRAIECIESMFEQGNGVCLSTVHKAKGLEARKCVVLNHETIESNRATRGWQKEQERNVHYVALTRAIDTLVYA